MENTNKSGIQGGVGVVVNSPEKTVYTHVWECIKDGNVFIDRLKVPGGWLVQSQNQCIRSMTNGPVVAGMMAMCFYPDPGHAWNPPVKVLDEPMVLPNRAERRHPKQKKVSP